MKKQLLAAIAGMLCLCLVYSGCSSGSGSASYDNSASAPSASQDTSSSPSYSMSEDGGVSGWDEKAEWGEDIAWDDDAVEPTPGESGSNSAGDLDRRKIIRNAYLSIETKEFDQSIALLEQKVEEYGGFVESSSVEGNTYSSSSRRNASYQLRIPAGNFSAFLNDTGGIGNVYNKTVESNEITDQYFDTQARLESLRMQEERLLEILSKAEELTAVIELEQALSDVRYQIENLTTTLRKYDGLVQYSTVHINLAEVYEITPVVEMPTALGERISQQFAASTERVRHSLENLLVAVIGGLPLILWFLLWVAILGGIIALIVWLCTRSAKKAAAKRPQPYGGYPRPGVPPAPGAAPHYTPGGYGAPAPGVPTPNAPEPSPQETPDSEEPETPEEKED